MLLRHLQLLQVLLPLRNPPLGRLRLPFFIILQQRPHSTNALKALLVLHAVPCHSGFVAGAGLAAFLVAAGVVGAFRAAGSFDNGVAVGVTLAIVGISWEGDCKEEMGILGMGLDLILGWAEVAYIA